MTDQATHEMQMPTVTEAHKRFKPFVGKFRAEVKMWMGPGDPHVSTGTMTNTLELNDLYLHHHYEGDADEGPFPNFKGRGYFAYNTAREQYEGVWLDTAASMLQIEIGAVDPSGKVWTMSGEMTCPQTGQSFTKRSIITVKDKDHHSMEMFFKGPDGNEMKGMEIQYTRKKK